MVSVQELQKLEKNKQKIKKEIYTKIYYQFSNKITRNAELSQKHTYLTIPPFLLGYPTYSLKNAAKYIARQFERSGFDVQIYGDINLLVQWKVKKDKTPEENHEPNDDGSFPSLMNLRKTARKYK